MSTLEVNNIKDTGSNSLISSDGSGTFTINNGVLKMTPAFTARITASSQSIGDSVDTKVQMDDEILDTDGCYDDTTNYRFTPTVAGKYFVYGYAYLDSQASSNFDQGRLYIFKNGSAVNQSANNMGGNFPEAMTINVNNILDLNGTTDYVELYAWINDTSGTPIVRGQRFAEFGAYRIGT